MCNWLINNVIVLFMRKETRFMMAMLWAQQIMKQDTLEKAKAMYARVPRLLKEKVKQILIDSGLEEIVTD